MSRIRRFVLLSVLTVCGGLGLSACQSAPGLAAQVGDVRLTDAQVEQIIAQIDEDLTKTEERRLAQQSAQPQPPGAPAPTSAGLPAEVHGGVRQRIVEFTVFNELARRYAADKGLVLPAQDYAAAAAQIGVSEQNPYVKLAVDSNAYHQLLETNAQQGTPTESDLREAFRRAATAGALAEGVSFDQVRAELEGLPPIKTGVWLRAELAAVAERAGVMISPRYQPIEIATGTLAGQSGNLVLIALPLDVGDGSPAVRDLG